MKATFPKSAIPISRTARERLNLTDERYDNHGFLLIRSGKEARELVMVYAEIFGETAPSSSTLHGAGHIVTAWQILLEVFSQEHQSGKPSMLAVLTKSLNQENLEKELTEFAWNFPNGVSLQESELPKDNLSFDENKTFQKWVLIQLIQSNPAFRSFAHLFQNKGIDDDKATWSAVESIDKILDRQKPEGETPIATLKKPIIAAPNSVKDQLLYILTHWGYLLGDWTNNLLGALDMIEEETQFRIPGPGPELGPGLETLDGSARFSHDDEWMPHVVLLAKNVLVWLSQLSHTYRQDIRRLDQIPDEELNLIASRGFNALWLIGLWERSPASRAIKQRIGNMEAAASAYSLFGYSIAEELGGWSALENLSHRAAERGIRLSSDMVPNHVGIDSDWVRHHPDRLLGISECPYPGYSFFSDDLSGDDMVDIRLEDHYYDKSDAAVVFQHRDKGTGAIRFIYHGNDGTSMPWNDTAQINFLNPEAREAVIQDILHVARNFPIIRFDAAMVLAKKHIRRLWFPAPGSGGAIPSRSEHALSDQAFNAALPVEFWRDVVDRVAAEAPGTLLLAEAFWMMEGYFVRSLGMHRVYNSAFMNMLRNQKNAEYRSIIKETLAFDPGILQRFVNFMNNPDEETAVKQFGKDDRYFAVCTLLVTLPGLPMVGHGQIEGLSEKYGMEYIKAFQEEHPDNELIARHEREIFPLLVKRYLFAGASSFRLYDLLDNHGVVESVYAFSNAFGSEQALIIVNNAFEKATGTIKQASPVDTDNLKVKEIADVLVPEGSRNGDWLLMREQVTGLWFIRSAGELRDNGLKISIDGFGRHAFLDIRVIAEASDGAWGTLSSELDGAGVQDMDIALAEIRLRPVKQALATLLPHEMVNNLATCIRKGKNPGRWLNRKQIERALSSIRDKSVIDMGDIARAVDRIQWRLEASAKLWRFLNRSVRRQLSRKFGEAGYDEALFLAVWSILSIPGAGRWHEWGLDSWMKSHIQAPASEELCRDLAVALNLPSWVKIAKKPLKALGVLMSNSEVRRLCGINYWEGEFWYNLEGWNAFVRLTILTVASESTSRKDLLRLIKHWSKAANAAEYRLKLLLKSAH